MSDERATFAARLDEAGVTSRRFINVPNGEKGGKGNTNGHEQPGNWLRHTDVSGNYGVHPGGTGECERWLVEFDIDDYDGEIERDALDELPATFTVESPHTQPDDPGHRYYAVDRDDVVVIEELAGSLNPQPSWGEIKALGQYVVGPGSQLDGCSKEWCEECAKTDGGWYRIAEEREIAALSREQLERVLKADPGIDTDDEQPKASELFGYTDDEENEHEDYTGPELTEDQVEDALDHVDEMLDYSEWLRVGFAVHDWDDGATGKERFEEWSQSNEERWNRDRDEGQRIINDIWDNGRPNGSVTVGTLVHYAKQGGWSGPSGGSRSNSGDEAGGLPQPSDFSVYEGCYGYYTEETDSEGERWSKWHEAATFQLETRSFIIEDGGATVTVELTVHPASDEPPYDVTVPIDAFTEPRKFRQKVATGRTTTYDLGTSFLNKIRRFVGDQDAPIRTPTRQIGLHGSEFVTPDGVLTADGWSDDPDTILVDNDTTVPQKWALDPEAGVDYDSDAVATILETLPQTRENERFLPVLGWFYAAALRPLIMEWSGEFNILNITGDTGAGKTATLSMLWQLFGMDGEPLSTTGTAFTRLTAFSSSNAVPVWFDEFKPAEMSEYQQDTFLELLRKSTRGGTEPKGNADQTEDQWHLRAPTVVTGEQLVSGPAEERRSIQTVFTSAVTDEDREEFRHFARLSGGYYVDDNGETVYCDEPNLADHARAYYTWVLNREDDTLEQDWHRAGERVTTLLADADVSVHPTVKQGFQTILFGCWLYRGLCDALGADADAAGVTDANVLDAIMTTAETGTGSEHVSHLDRLLGLAARASAADYLEAGEHYKLVTPRDGTEDNEELRLKLATSFDAIRKYARDHDVQDGDLLDAAHDYRIRIQDAEDDGGSVVDASSVETFGLNKTTAFSVQTATEHIEAFERGMFDPEDETAEEDTDETIDIVSLEPGEYVTIEAMAASVLEPAPWLAGEGTVSDASGRIDYVVRGEVETEIEQGAMHRLTDVKVTTDDDGMTILEIRGGTTGVEAIGPRASEQHTVTETAETDGGAVDDVEPTAVQAVTRAVDNDGDEISFAELQALVSSNHDIEPDTVGDAIERAVEQGRIIDAGEGRYQPS